MSVFTELIDSKVLRILKLFVDGKSALFHLQKISIDAKVPLGSTFRIVNKLVKLGIIEHISVGRMKIYKLSDNKKTAELIAFLGGKK